MKRLIKTSHNSLRQIRHGRVRAQIFGTAKAPRLSVFRSLKHINAQLIDDEKGATLASVVSKTISAQKFEGKTAKVAVAYLTGKKLAELAVAKGITKVAFDRGGYKYHGRVAALAEGARAGGLKF